MSSSTETDRRIKQMCAFIESEAEERADEIRRKTESDCQIEIDNTVRAMRQQLDEEFAIKIKKLQTDDKVSMSTVFTKNRVTKMEAREGLLRSLREETLATLADVSKGNTYVELVQNLLVQGLFKLQEPVVEVVCRAKDKDAVDRALKLALESEKLNKLKPSVTISKTALDAKSAGGFILYADNGRILCNQTFEERLTIAYHDLLPEIRKTFNDFKI